jgi:hypothetical protein
VVKAARIGCGKARSIVQSPAPNCTGAFERPRGRTLRASCTGDQKYSSSVALEPGSELMSPMDRPLLAQRPVPVEFACIR